MNELSSSYRLPPNCAAVIMAGGSGTRLWPLSRQNHPKQLLKIFGGRSSLRDAFERLALAFPVDSIYVIGLAEHRSLIAKEMPELSPDNFIGEPTGRDTAAAIALSASILQQKNPGTIMGVFSADHQIRPAERFMQAVARAYRCVEKNHRCLMTFGIRPTSAHTGMGYLELDAQIEAEVWEVRAFREKPDARTAQSYVESGRHFWNGGMFVWQCGRILEELSARLPETFAAAREIAEARNPSERENLAARLYPALQRISIDHAVMEKASDIRMIEMNVHWIDVGHWTALPAILGTDKAGNTVSGARLAHLDSSNNIIVSEGGHLIATIGVDDLVIVHSEDATLICRRDQVDKIKDLVGRLRESGSKAL
ncbi:MAG TPA: sugar phosphate nucleotidyltransferase [Phycisphaerae bacterium]|nr:sugar phosphate nucleotidyltransferase [Phycisphaerae bacterium]